MKIAHIFNENIYKPSYISKNIDLSEKMSLIVGDFWGIQSFIFDGLTTTNAAKVLRAKSAFIQIFMEILAKYICKKLNIDTKYILTTNAGKFEILAPLSEVDLSNIKNKVDEYFLENFYGLSGVGIVNIDVTKKEWINNYKDFRARVAQEVEKIKFKKFNLTNLNPILKYDTTINNQTLCKICNKRKITDENCDICNTFKDFGKKLTHKQQEEIYSDELGVIFDDFVAKIVLDKRLKSYIPSKDLKPLDFKNIAQNSCKDTDTGIQALGILKADVDGMGDFIKNTNVTNNFENFDRFSKGLDSFFSLYVTGLLRKKYRNIYTVFAGGDDLFLVGAWDEIMEFSRETRDTFKKYINNKLSISFGIAIAKETIPISYLANYTEELLEKSKEIDGKDAITIWNETVKWDSYLKVFQNLQDKFKTFEEALNTTFLYRLLEFCDMSKRVKFNNDIPSTIWKSKLAYLFAKNIDENYQSLLEVLYKNIEKYPQETKIFLNEFIYKRRER